MIKLRRMSWARHVACIGELRHAYKVLVRKTEGKRPLGRPRSKWEDDVKINVKEKWCVSTTFVWLSIGSSSWLL
jgi:hypothetical protein